MIEPLPALCSSSGPDVDASPVLAYVSSACRVALPMSKQRPFTEYSPVRYHDRYRSAWSFRSQPTVANESASARAIDVSSVHSPAFRPCGPPSRYPVTGSNVPGGLNSTAAPSASPMARPSRAPMRRSFSGDTVIGATYHGRIGGTATSRTSTCVAVARPYPGLGFRRGSAPTPETHRRHCHGS